MSARLAEAMQAALRLLYPRRARCLGCGALIGCDLDWLCDECARTLVPCHAHARLRTLGASHVSCAHIAYAYGPVTRGLMHAFKYGGTRELAPLLAAGMCQTLARAGAAFDLLVPVPLHPARQRARGFNQAALLAALVARQTGIPQGEGHLIRTRNVRKQSHLAGQARIDNVMGAFRATRALDGLRILLVDDVVTTGATAQACAEALRRAGAADVQVLAFTGVVAPPAR